MTRTNKPDVSVIVSCYKGGASLPTCLDALLSQSLKNIEIICINDGSPDNTASILKDYANRDGRIIPITNKQNLGISKSRNKGIKLASADYIQIYRLRIKFSVNLLLINTTSSSLRGYTMKMRIFARRTCVAVIIFITLMSNYTITFAMIRARCPIRSLMRPKKIQQLTIYISLLGFLIFSRRIIFLKNTITCSGIFSILSNYSH